MRMAIVDKDGLVLNVIEIEPGAEWKAPPETTLMEVTPGCTVGARRSGSTWEPPPPVLGEPPRFEMIATELENAVDLQEVKTALVQLVRQL